MRVVQILVTLSFGDAVSNDCLAIHKLLEKNGYKSSIFVENIDKRINASYVKKYSSLPKLKADDVILYHLSTGSELNLKVKDFPCRKFLIYHNITPSHYFASYNGATTKLCAMGADETILLKDTFEAGFCDSQYNLDELRKIGYTCPLVVRPILIPFEDYKKKPSQEVVDKFGSNKDLVKNVIFIGRIAPNKCQEDIISTAYAYNKLYGDEKCKVRFILVGSANGTEKYLSELIAFAKILELDNVIFTKQIPFDEILGFYKTADCLLCMSEHEGFCVPLVEAMCFDVPILAYKAAAVPETMGDSGVLLETKDPATSAMYLHEILFEKDLRSQIIEDERERLKRFSYDVVSKEFIDTLKQYIEGVKS